MLEREMYRRGGGTSGSPFGDGARGHGAQARPGQCQGPLSRVIYVSVSRETKLPSVCATSETFCVRKCQFLNKLQLLIREG